MSRIVFSSNAQARASLISEHRITIYIEGNNSDPYFYSKLLAYYTFINPRTSFRIIYARELESNTGGKARLLGHFNTLLENGELSAQIANRKRYKLFFIDKDVDDIIDAKINSVHIHYTMYYDVENYFFAHGDLTDSLACIGSVSIESATQIIGEQNTLTSLIAQNWKEWVKICLAIKIIGQNSDVNYGCSASLVNEGGFGEFIQVTYDDLIASLKEKYLILGLEDQFNEAFQKSQITVEELYRNGDFHKIYKGKWFSSTVVNYLSRFNHGIRIDLNGIGSKYFGRHLSSTLDFSQGWAITLITANRG